MGWKCGWLRHGLEVSFPSSLEGFLTALAGLVLRAETEVWRTETGILPWSPLQNRL